MNSRELEHLVTLGEDSRRQFKKELRNADSLAADMVAFSNSEGGVILIGVADDGSIPGLTLEDVRRVNQLIGNAATQHVRSPISPRTENVPAGDDRVVIAVTVPAGIEKPYFDRQGIIWVKSGSDKRRIQSKEELRRLFQNVDLLHADEVPTAARVGTLDRLRFRDFLADIYQQELPEHEDALIQLLENMNLATAGKLNLAGLLLFGRHPQIAKPAFLVKAVRYPGTSVDVERYLDSEDFEGPLSKVFEGALDFVLRSLPKQQQDRGVNEPGRPAIPRIVFEELLVNALIHRDYFVEAPVRLFVFENRIEIVSPGHLPNHLTVEKIRAGNSVLRNPILASFAAKGVLPYRGLGTGIRRALTEWSAIDFCDDREACTFTATTRFVKVQGEPINEPINHRNKPINLPSAPDGEPIRKVDDRIVEQIEMDPHLSYDALAASIGIGRSTVMRHVQGLKNRGVLRRVGSRKLGYWEVAEKTRSKTP
ncbi:MAG: putative DNA binding domain-containing protein [Planctomycetota bacterium]|nr:putative DNA binding domain-containing protein [Planctomycetota bacterium]